MPKPLQLVADEHISKTDDSGLSDEQVSALVQLLARADTHEVLEVFSTLGPDGARKLGRELRHAAETMPGRGELYRKALMALICADLAQPFS